MTDDELPGGFVPLPTRDPLLCPSEEKAARETANCAVQLEYIEHLVLDVRINVIRESHLLELHRLAVEGLFPCGGQYRRTNRTAKLEGGGATHVPPEPALVPGLVREALDRINDPAGGHVLARAAYALWRFNWIHPFAGGNGRTSRAVAYLTLCIDLGRCIPGTPSIPTRIAERQDEYVAGLREADAAPEGHEHLGLMTRLFATAAVETLQAFVAEAQRRKEQREP
ncbi:MAG: Fic family protein [Labilithrix sp.]|nr:Fic family protein [Labilithrix sp.]